MPKRKREEEEWEVEKLIAHSREKGDPHVLRYRVRWVGYSEADDSWELESNLENSPGIIREYWQLLATQKNTTYEDAYGFLTKRPETNSTAKEVVQRHVLSVAQASNGAVEFVSLRDATPDAEMKPQLELKMRVDPVKMKANQLDELKMWEAVMNDASERAGEAALVVENMVDRAGPPVGFTYITDYKPADGVDIPNDPFLHCECVAVLGDAKSGCGSGKQCCPKQNEQKFAYTALGRMRANTDREPIYECNKNCLCSVEFCPNRVVQRGRKCVLKIVKMAGKGWGVITTQDIPKYSFVTEYVGEVITMTERARREKAYNEDMSYLFDLDYEGDDHAEYTVDARHYGNVAHFINHSCDPNMVVRNVWINCLLPNLPRLAFFTTRGIAAGEELTFDYQPLSLLDEEDSDDDNKSPTKATRSATDDAVHTSPRKTHKVACQCKASNCRKVLWT